MTSVENPVEIILDKVNCDCGKQISKKNISTHIKTKAHLKACEPKVDTVPIPETKSESEVKEVKSEPKNNNPALKLKKEFTSINQKLDFLIEMVDAIYYDCFEEDQEEQPEQKQ